MSRTIYFEGQLYNLDPPRTQKAKVKPSQNLSFWGSVALAFLVVVVASYLLRFLSQAPTKWQVVQKEERQRVSDFPRQEGAIEWPAQKTLNNSHLV